jgi:hypothetical protein
VRIRRTLQIYRNDQQRLYDADSPNIHHIQSNMLFFPEEEGS